MRMTTNGRSRKVSEALTNNVAELVWWFPTTSEQYRIRGALAFVGGGRFDHDEDLAEVRREMWEKSSDASRESFFASGASGAAFLEEETYIPKGGRDEEGNILPPPDSFLLMLLVPRYCDYLCLKKMYRQVDKVVDGKWEASRVNP